MILPSRYMVTKIAAEHARRFAEAYLDDPVTAWGESSIFNWPENDKASQLRIHEIEDEIEERMWPDLRDAIAEIFVKHATAVFNAERERAEGEPIQPRPRLAFHQLFTVEGHSVFINPWQIVAMKDIPVPVAKSGFGTRVILADGSAYDFPIPYGILYGTFLAQANGEDADT